MAVWQFTKEGDISNGISVISFQQLVEIIERTNSNSIDIESINMGESLVHNDLVYINQINGKFYRSFNTGLANQAQNVIGAYSFLHNKHSIIFSGIIKGFSNLIPGRIYYLSGTPGEFNITTVASNVIVGRAVSTTELLLDISGDVDVPASSGYDTSIVNGETAEGNSLTDPTDTATLQYSKVAYDNSVPPLIMFARAGEVSVKIDFATEYTDNSFAIQIGDDLYGGEFIENEDFNAPVILTTVSLTPEPPVLDDDIVTLSATSATDEGGAIVYTASITKPQPTPLTINLSNSAVIVIQEGSTNGSVVTTAPTVATDSNITVGINGYSGVLYNTLDTSDTVSTLVRNIEVAPPPALDDDIVTLIATPTVIEGSEITYTASITKPQVTDLSLVLSNGKLITIESGNYNGTVTAISPEVTTDTNVTVGINTYSGVVYNSLDISDTTTTLVSNSTVTEITYDTSIVNPESNEGIGLTDPTGTMTLNFNKRSYDAAVPALIMFVSVNGVVAKIDYASEYTVYPFSITAGGVTYSGVFNENEDFNTPTVLTVI